jgi:hypothetical protein
MRQRIKGRLQAVCPGSVWLNGRYVVSVSGLDVCELNRYNKEQSKERRRVVHSALDLMSRPTPHGTWRRRVAVVTQQHVAVREGRSARLAGATGGCTCIHLHSTIHM